MSKGSNIMLVVALGLASFAGTASGKKLHFPAAGVVCDAYFCADTGGISDRLTTQYLGKKQGQQLAAQGQFDRTEFTFDNGIFCSIKARECRKDRYFGTDGKRSGAIDKGTTDRLFIR